MYERVNRSFTSVVNQIHTCIHILYIHIYSHSFIHVNIHICRQINAYTHNQIYMHTYNNTIMHTLIYCTYINLTVLVLCEQETSPNQLSIKNPPPKETLLHGSRDTSSAMSDAKSKFILEHSPIMDVYFNLGRRDEVGDVHLCPAPFRVFLSHSPIRYACTKYLGRQFCIQNIIIVSILYHDR